MLGAIAGGHTNQAYSIISTRTSFSALTWCVPLCWVRGQMPALFQQTRRQAPPWPASWGSELCHRSQDASSTEILQVITKCLLFYLFAICAFLCEFGKEPPLLLPSPQHFSLCPHQCRCFSCVREQRAEWWPYSHISSTGKLTAEFTSRKASKYPCHNNHCRWNTSSTARTAINTWVCFSHFVQFF